MNVIFHVYGNVIIPTDNFIFFGDLVGLRNFTDKHGEWIASDKKVMLDEITKCYNYVFFGQRFTSV
jgi:hypothetical protein